MLILLTGTDLYRIEQTINSYKAKLNPLYLLLNYHHFSSTQIDTALSTARTFAFDDDGKLIVINDCDFKQFNTTIELFDCLPNLPKTTILIFTATSIDKRLKVVKQLLKYGKLYEFNLISPWRTDLIADYIRTQARQLNLSFNSLIINYLTTAIGNDTARIHSELNKLALAQKTANFKESLTIEQIKQLIPKNNQNSIKLADAIRQGDTSKTLQLTQSLLSHAVHPLVIVATLLTQFRTWLWVASALKHNNNDTNIAQLCNVNPQRLYYLCQEVRNLSLSTLSEVISQLFELEITLKQGNSSQIIIPSLLLLAEKLAQNTTKRAASRIPKRSPR